MAACHLVTLLTDFGLEDTYVGAMKGVMLGIDPAVYFVDLCHRVPPQDVRQAAFLLASAYPYFPPGTVHLIVVDPGVGGPRRPVVLATSRAFFVAPDNGVLSYVLAREQPTIAIPPASAEGMASVPLAPPLSAVHLTDPRWWRPEVSATFHGRDLFAPVAAHLSRGVPLRDLGTPVDALLAFPLPRPRREADGRLHGHVIHVDAFGNLITDITAADLPKAPISLQVAGHRIHGLSRSYAEGGELLALIGSAGYLEIAARNASAAQRLGAQVGEPVHVGGASEA